MRGLSGVNKAVGYGSSMLLLALASLAAIPAMIHASGDRAWGSIATGQAVGAVAAVVVAFGWQLSGPAEIARGSAQSRRRSYVESLRLKGSLFVPVAGLAAAVAAVVAPSDPSFAAVGAVSFAALGLTANWVFVGLGRPFAMLGAETMPRVAGTVAGILLMLDGRDARVGLACQLAGMLVAVGLSSTWVFRATSPGAEPPFRALRVVVAEQRHGLTTTVMSAVYVALPVMIVSLVAPATQPVFALVDKVQRQIAVAAGPMVTVLQGWVPNAGARVQAQRVRRAIQFALAGAVVATAGLVVVAPWLFDRLSGGQIRVGTIPTVLAASFVGLAFLDNVMSKVVLSTVGRLDIASRATMWGSVVGLPAVVVGAAVWGATGALFGVVLGLLLRVALTWYGWTRHKPDGGEESA